MKKGNIRRESWEKTDGKRDEQIGGEILEMGSEMGNKDGEMAMSHEAIDCETRER